jgi:hypothetical protein
MKDFFEKLKIPTLLGLSIIALGIASGVFLTLRQQVFTSKASSNITPQNLSLSNISDTEITISWETSNPTPSFVTYGVSSPTETTVLDERDNNSPTPYSTHYFTIKNLLPKTTYQYKITSGKISSQVQQFTTASPITQQTGFRPINGALLNGDKPLDEGVIYLSIEGASLQSGVIKSSGNFLIPISQIRNSDLSDIFPLTDDTIGKLTVFSPKGQSTAVFKIKNDLPAIHLNEDLDLTNITLPTTSYDLNEDGKINSADNSIINNIIIQKSGTDPRNKKADLNKDAAVDYKDSELMIQKIKELGSQ